MEEYKADSSQYDIFGANMTVDEKASISSIGYNLACQSCQCNCRLCRGGKMPDDPGVAGEEEIESALMDLLAA